MHWQSSILPYLILSLQLLCQPLWSSGDSPQPLWQGDPCPGKGDGWDGCPSLSHQAALCWKHLWGFEPAHCWCTARSGSSKVHRRPVQHLQREGHQSASPMQQMMSASCCRRMPQWVLTRIMPAYPLVLCLWCLTVEMVWTLSVSLF